MENERVTIVDWIQRYGSYIKLKRTTISLAISIFDKLAHVNEKTRRSEELIENLTAISLFIASKVEEERPPSIKQLVDTS